MRSRIFLTTGPVLVGLLVAWVQDPVSRPRKVDRSARPVFAPRDWQGVFFSDLFAEGLSGERPLLAAGSGNPADPALPLPGDPPAAAAAGDSNRVGWSSLIDRETLENEIKRLQIELESRITTPAKYSTGYRQAHHTFVLLSAWFAVVFEYDGDIRWKSSAGDVVATMMRASVNTRSAGADSFRFASQAKQSLTDMIRGESFAGQEKAVAAVDWSQAVERTELMIRLNDLADELAQATSGEKEFAAAKGTLAGTAGAVAAIGRMLARPGMVNADDSSYAALAGSMENAAMELKQSMTIPDLSAAQATVNRLRQSCDSCHADWR